MRYYEAFSKREHVSTPIKNEMELLDKCINKIHIKGEEMYLIMLDFSLGKMTYEELAARLGEIQNI